MRIIAAASELFARHGYDNVGTGQIADAVGITAGALYRHFDSKEALLADAVIDSFDRAMTVIDAVGSDDLHAAIEGIAATAASRRDLGVLWNRETRFLDDENRARMRGRFFEFLDTLTDILQAARPTIARADADLLAWSALGVLTSASYHSTRIDVPRLTEVLAAMTVAVCTVELSPHDGELARPAAGGVEVVGLTPRSRREALLAVAPALFVERGFQSVSMADLGAAVGISNAGVYRHFGSKADLLAAVVARAAEPLQLDLTRALASAGTPLAALDRAVQGYSRFSLAHPDLIGVLISEVVNLPDAVRHAVRRAQREYVSEWVRLLRAAGNDLDEIEPRVRIHAALTVVNDVARTDHLRRRPHIAGELPLIASQTFGARQ